MKFNEFVNKMIAQGGIDKDGRYGKQCMDLYNYYMVNVIGLEDGKTGADYAKNILNNAYVMENVERIDNYLNFTPKKGDIAVFTGGEYGHVSICLGINDGINTFKSLDQNWVSQKLTEEWHNYTYLAPIVFLRPKNQTNIIDETTADTFNVIVTADVLNVRTGPGINYPIKSYNELTQNAKEQVMEKVGYAANGLVKGVVCTVSEVQNNFGKIPSGWISLDYCSKV